MVVFSREQSRYATLDTFGRGALLDAGFGFGTIGRGIFLDAGFGFGTIGRGIFFAFGGCNANHALALALGKGGGVRLCALGPIGSGAGSGMGGGLFEKANGMTGGSGAGSKPL
jgi:hypothetical protein